MSVSGGCWGCGNFGRFDGLKDIGLDPCSRCDKTESGRGSFYHKKEYVNTKVNIKNEQSVENEINDLEFSDEICIHRDTGIVEGILDIVKRIFKRKDKIIKIKGDSDMGFKMEFNWYLVGEATNMSMDNDGKIMLTKNEERVYPVGHRVPVILKESGCLGFAVIDSVLITVGKTVVGATMVEELPIGVAKHYYQQWVNSVGRGHSTTTLP